MPTFAVNVVNNQVLLNVNVAGDPTAQRDQAPNEGSIWTALLDTGAQCTLVTSRIIDQLGVPSVGVGSFIPANGEPVETEIYRLSIGVPIALGPEPSAPTFSTGSTVDAMLLPFTPSEYDVIFGMDLISGYHITLHNGVFVCSN